MLANHISSYYVPILPINAQVLLQLLIIIKDFKNNKILNDRHFF